jgi:CubicO group peptidase (beta-lactamase class C family)
MAAAAAKEKGLLPGFEATLDAHFEAMVSDEAFKVPGVVVLAKRGKDTYSKAFGLADVASGRAMENDAMFRMWSMTKVLSNAVALRLYELDLFKLEDPVGCETRLFWSHFYTKKDRPPT